MSHFQPSQPNGDGISGNMRHRLKQVRRERADPRHFGPNVGLAVFMNMGFARRAESFQGVRLFFHSIAASRNLLAAPAWSEVGSQSSGCDPPVRQPKSVSCTCFDHATAARMMPQTTGVDSSGSTAITARFPRINWGYVPDFPSDCFIGCSSSKMSGEGPRQLRLKCATPSSGLHFVGQNIAGIESQDVRVSSNSRHVWAQPVDAEDLPVLPSESKRRFMDLDVCGACGNEFGPVDRDGPDRFQCEENPQIFIQHLPIIVRSLYLGAHGSWD